MTTKLYSYYRSSASYRVRIALHYKKISFEYQPVHLLNEGGEQFKEPYRELNPHSQVPCLIHDGAAVNQSMAIIELLEEEHPSPHLFPKSAIQRAKVREVCEVVNSGMQPFVNLSTLNYLQEKMGVADELKTEWILHFLDKGFASLEQILKKTAGDFCFGDEVTAADLFLVPQVFSAQRYPFDIGRFPHVARVNRNCETLEAFVKAHPYRQPDCPSELRIEG